MAYAFNDDKSKADLSDLFTLVTFKNYSSATVRAGDAVSFGMSGGDASKVMGIRSFKVTGTGSTGLDLGITKIDYSVSPSVTMFVTIRNFGTTDRTVSINSVTVEALVVDD